MVEDLRGGMRNGASNSLREPMHSIEEGSNIRRDLLFCSPPLHLPPPLQNPSYLPVYLQDVLGLSNSKIGNLQAIAQFLCNASKSVP